MEEQDITLEMVINAGLLKPGTQIYAASDNTVTGTLNGDGSITLKIDDVIKTFPYPSGAARAIRNISISGWIFWKVKEDDKLIELLAYKEKYKALSL
nr:hypothetical protein [Pedobacter sp. AK013]